MNGEKDLIENKPNTDSLLRMAEIIGNEIENIREEEPGLIRTEKYLMQELDGIRVQLVVIYVQKLKQEMGVSWSKLI